MCTSGPWHRVMLPYRPPYSASFLLTVKYTVYLYMRESFCSPCSLRLQPTPPTISTVSAIVWAIALCKMALCIISIKFMHCIVVLLYIVYRTYSVDYTRPNKVQYLCSLHEHSEDSFLKGMTQMGPLPILFVANKIEEYVCIYESMNTGIINLYHWTPLVAYWPNLSLTVPRTSRFH